MIRSPNTNLLRPVLLVLAAASLMPLIVSNTSCTAIGYAVGSALTKDDPPRVVPAGEALQVEPGTPVSIAIEDSAAVSGIYLGTARLDDAAYAPHAVAWRTRTPDAPALGATIAIERRNARRDSVIFDGFAYRTLLMRPSAGGAQQAIPFSGLRAMHPAAGRVWTREQLAVLDASGSLPSRDAILVGLGLPFDWNRRVATEPAGSRWAKASKFRDTAAVALDRVRALEVPSPRTVRTVCILAGLAVDATLVVVAVAAATWRGPFDSGSGCDAGTGSVWARVAPEPTNRDFDVLAGEFRPAGWAARPERAPLAPAP